MSDLRFKIRHDPPPKVGQTWRQKSSFAMRDFKTYLSVLKTCFSDIPAHLRIKNAQEQRHLPTPSEL